VAAPGGTLGDVSSANRKEGVVASSSALAYGSQGTFTQVDFSPEAVFQANHAILSDA